ncbi:hypothetical protein FHG87_015356 [Trinorchestia longiramus]|nr:hypothetical protein FHG87_015356 [Trinorchestia longiramus]
MASKFAIREKQVKKCFERSEGNAACEQDTQVSAQLRGICCESHGSTTNESRDEGSCHRPMSKQDIRSESRDKARPRTTRSTTAKPN